MKSLTIQGLFRPIVASNSLLVVVFMLVSITATGIGWLSARSNLEKRRNEQLELSTLSIESSIQQRMSRYEEIVRGGGGLHSSLNNEVTKEQWHKYVESLKIRALYPGLQAVGYLDYVNATDLSSYIQSVRSADAIDYNVYPTSSSQFYTPIVRIEPLDDTNKSFVGFDISSVSSVQEALTMANGSGGVESSGVVSLNQDDPDHSPGLVLVSSLYSVAEDVKSASLTGYTYALVDIQDMMSSIDRGAMGQETDYQIRTPGTSGSDGLLFSTSPGAVLTKVFSKDIRVLGHTWSVELSRDSSVVSPTERQQPTTILIFGAIISLLLGVLVTSIIRGRTSVQNYERTLEIQVAKDELLSLASHQLRTPATGVKQYIGMLLEGYTGRLTKEQKGMLSKAYDANELQLEIISQILHVTRLESGRLHLKRVRVDLIALVRDVVEDLRKLCAKKSQHITFDPTISTLPTRIDTLYLRMVIENLITNASKYTQVGGSIEVGVYIHNKTQGFFVKDNGVGIHRKDIPNLFRKFSRIPNKLSIEAGGSGMGLYLSKQIVMMHKGTITVTSKQYRGTTFFVNFLRDKRLLPTLGNGKKRANSHLHIG